MQPTDADAFLALLTDVAEVMGHRPISSRAGMHFFDALREHPYRRVQGVLKTWMVTRHKLPTVADIARECADLASADRERIAKAEAAAFHRDPTYAGPSEVGKRAIRQLRALLRDGQRKPGKWWARDILDAHAQGLPHPRTGHALSDMQVQYARAAMGDLASLSRVPGEDDEELAA